MLRFLTAGSVDDGKSTLIGRLLYDTKTIFDDQLAAIEQHQQQARRRRVDLSLLTDGLNAEREQGITIDVAYRYFATPKRKFIIADTPGHEQYTRNMVTGASTARSGRSCWSMRARALSTQIAPPRDDRAPARHSASGRRGQQDGPGRLFARTSSTRSSPNSPRFARALGIDDVRFVPMSALRGDMVVERGENLRWYTGPTLLEMLEDVTCSEDRAPAPFRFPVQLVVPPARGEVAALRGYMGRIESGSVAVGDAVTVLPRGRTTRSREIRHATTARWQSRTSPQCGDAGARRRDRHFARRHAGHAGGDAPEAREDCRARCLLVRRASRSTRAARTCSSTRRARCARAFAAARHVERVTRWTEAGAGRARNERHRPVALTLAAAAVRPTAIDDNRATGRFILIDEATNHTVAAGMIR